MLAASSLLYSRGVSLLDILEISTLGDEIMEWSDTYCICRMPISVFLLCEITVLLIHQAEELSFCCRVNFPPRTQGEWIDASYPLGPQERRMLKSRENLDEDREILQSLCSVCSMIDTDQRENNMSNKPKRANKSVNLSTCVTWKNPKWKCK